MYRKVPPRFELGSLDSKSRVLTITPWDRARGYHRGRRVFRCSGPSMPVSLRKQGPVRDLNPGPLAPKARIIPLDQQATIRDHHHLATTQSQAVRIARSSDLRLLTNSTQGCAPANVRIGRPATHPCMHFTLLPTCQALRRQPTDYFFLNWPTLRTGCARPTVHGLEINKRTNR